MTTDKIIEVKIRGSHIIRDSGTAGVQHEGNAAVLRMDFDPGWDGFAKTVTFWNARGENPVQRILTADLLEDLQASNRVYRCPIPPEAMTEAGNLTYVVDGAAEGIRQRSVEDRLRVVAADYAPEAGESTDPTPTRAEQLQLQVDTLHDRLQQGIAAAAAAKESAGAAEGSEWQAALSCQAAQDAAAVAAESRDAAADSEAKAKLYADQTEASVSGVASFNGRGGHVLPQSGDYTADMVGAAPAGFGLGEPVPPQIELADINKSGFYRCWLQKSNGDPANGWHTLHAIVNGHYNNVHLSGAAFSGYIRRNKWDGVWDPWEWVNPPMEIGVEYRTTERYCGDPVYTQVMNLGYIGKGPHAIEHGIHVKEAIGLTVINSGYGDFTHITSVDPSFTPTVININPSEWAMGNTKVILRYTKT